MKTNEPKHESAASVSEHTPTPWALGGRRDNDNSVEIIVPGSRPSKDTIVALVQPLPFYDDRQKENAAFIVKAVNAHDALLEAVKLSLAMIKDRFISEHGMENVGAAWGACEKAVAKAEGK